MSHPNTSLSVAGETLAVPVTDADHAEGSAGAAVTLVEYGDYECPSCLNAEPIVRRLRADFGERLRVVFRHYPQSSVHARASAAAEAAEAAARQARFWDMHRALYARQADLADVDLTHLALSLGLDPYKFDADLSRGTAGRKVRDDFDGGRRSGVTGTPAFFIDGRRYRGAPDVAGLSAAVRDAAAVAGA